MNAAQAKRVDTALSEIERMLERLLKERDEEERLIAALKLVIAHAKTREGALVEGDDGDR